jgi:mono/diheme cytochrome c family protein
MAPVTHDLSRVNAGDVRAIAVYMTAQAGEPSPERRQKGEDLIASAESQPLLQANSTGNARGGSAPPSGDNDAGAAVYVGACASCHDSGRGRFFQGALNLRLSTSVNAPVPDNLARIVMLGIAPADGEQGPWMPAFGPSLTDDQIAALLTYIRAQASGQRAWRNVSATVRKIRQEDAH